MAKPAARRILLKSFAGILIEYLNDYPDRSVKMKKS